MLNLADEKYFCQSAYVNAQLWAWGSLKSCSVREAIIEWLENKIWYSLYRFVKTFTTYSLIEVKTVWLEIRELDDKGMNAILIKDAVKPEDFMVFSVNGSPCLFLCLKSSKKPSAWLYLRIYNHANARNKVKGANFNCVHQLLAASGGRMCQGTRRWWTVWWTDVSWSICS